MIGARAWVAAALLVGAAGIALYVSILRADNERQAGDITRLGALLTDATAALEQRAQAIAVLERERDELAARKDKVRIIREEIARAPQTSSCVDSPAVRITLERLRDQHARTGAPASPGRPVDLQSQPDPAASRQR